MVPLSNVLRQNGFDWFTRLQKAGAVQSTTLASPATYPKRKQRIIDIGTECKARLPARVCKAIHDSLDSHRTKMYCVRD